MCVAWRASVILPQAQTAVQLRYNGRGACDKRERGACYRGKGRGGGGVDVQKN